MLEFALLSSGSKANCAYITDGVTRVLVDCGLSAREAAIRLAGHGVEPSSIDAIVVTHEHGDHIGGVFQFAKRYKTRVLANCGTFTGCGGRFETISELCEEIDAANPFSVGGMTFSPFGISHDAEDPIAFVIKNETKSLALVTDLGELPTGIEERITGVDALVIESNHDPLLLSQSPYPWGLKERIRGRHGHLSNEDAAELVCCAASKGTIRYIIGAHISENSNHPQLVLDSLNAAWERGRGGDVDISVASIKHSTRLFSL